MSSTSWPALKAFGGWQGLITFYFVGLAFPIFYASRAFRHRYRNQHLRRELVIAGSIVHFSAIICRFAPAGIYLQEHVAEGDRSHAELLDTVLAYTVTLALSVVLGFAKLRHTISADCAALSNGIPHPRLHWWHTEGGELVHHLQAQLFAESTWLTLFTVWLMNILCGILTICIGLAIDHEVPWWLYPVYNVGGHLALLHAFSGLLEASTISLRISMMEDGLSLSRDEREAAYAWMVDTIVTVHCLKSALLGRSSAMPADEETGEDSSFSDEKTAEVLHQELRHEDETDILLV